MGKAVFKLMQWTGLKDKTGKDIYEGDIIKVVSSKIFVVEFKEGIYFPEIMVGGQQSMKFVEVIGNIYENPKSARRKHNTIMKLKTMKDIISEENFDGELRPSTFVIWPGELKQEVIKLVNQIVKDNKMDLDKLRFKSESSETYNILYSGKELMNTPIVLGQIGMMMFFHNIIEKDLK